MWRLKCQVDCLEFYSETVWQTFPGYKTEQEIFGLKYLDKKNKGNEKVGVLHQKQSHYNYQIGSRTENNTRRKISSVLLSPRSLEITKFCFKACSLQDMQKKKSPCHPLPTQFKVAPGTSSVTQNIINIGGLAGVQSLSNLRHLLESVPPAFHSQFFTGHCRQACWRPLTHPTLGEGKEPTAFFAFWRLLFQKSSPRIPGTPKVSESVQPSNQ